MKLKCLIVEDALFMREVYKFNLRDQNIDIVAESGDGMDALIQINQLKPDLVILDLILPLKNGLDVLKEVNRLSPQTKCLVISSLDDDAIKAQALALGAVQYMTKPFTRAQLLNAISELSIKLDEVING